MYRVRRLCKGLPQQSHQYGAYRISTSAEKDERVTALANQLIKSKSEQEKLAEKIAADAESDGLYRLALALAKSSRLAAEDISAGSPAICFPRAKIPMTD